MSNFDTVKYPKSPSTPQHQTVNKTLFVKTELPPKTENIDSSNYKFLESFTPVILLEENVGAFGKWNKILSKDTSGNYTSIGYVLSRDVAALRDTKPSVKANLEQNYLANDKEPAIDWKTQQANIPYDDKKNGRASVHYDTGIEKIENNLDDILRTSLVKATSLILKEYGKRSDEQYVNDLINKYYLFSRIESATFAFRKCSTFRLFVTLPKTYLFSNEIEVSQASDSFEENTNRSEASSEAEAQLTSAENISPETNRYITINFKDYSEYEKFFDDITNTLDKAETIFSAREWDITPDDINLDLKKETKDVKQFKEKIDNLILINIPASKIKEVYEDLDLESTYSFEALNVLKTTGNILTLGLANLETQDVRVLKWKGNLTIKIDKQAKKLVYMEFKTIKSEKIPLNIGVLKFIEDPTITNKTTVNYILERNKAKKNKEFKKTQNLLSSGIIGDITERDEFVDSVSMVLGIGSEGLGVTTDLTNFLTSFHYPLITQIVPKPLEISKCVTTNLDIIERTRNKAQIFANGIEERKKYQEKQKEKEGGILEDFYNAFNDNSTVKTKSKAVRILTGQEETPKEWEQIKEPDRSLKKLNEFYLPAIKELDLDRLLFEVTKCGANTVTAPTFAGWLKDYKNAKNFLDELAFSTVCNPFLSKTLKSLDGITLPTIPTYNPNKALADKLVEAWVKIISDIIVLGIRKLLEQWVKFCFGDPNKNGNNPAAASLTDDFANALSSNEEAISDTLDDLFSIDGQNLSPEDLAASREVARKNLINLFDNIFCLLTSRELCALLKGNRVQPEVFDLIASIMRNKYPQFKEKLSNQEDIRNLFKKLGNNIDLTICQDLENPTNALPSNIRCDDGTLQDARSRILGDKGLSPDLLDSILNDIKSQEEKNLESILKFIDSDQPFDFSNVPSILCKKTPDGQTIPPDVSIGLPIDSFKTLLNTLFDDVYETFNKEAVNWKTTTYSISQSSGRIVTFDSGSGKFITKDVSQNTGSDASLSVDNKKTIFPSYLYKDIIESNKFTQNKYAFDTTILGNKQQELDANLISDLLRQKVYIAEQSLSIFLDEFKALLLTFALYKATLLEENARFILTSGASWTDIGKYLLPNRSLSGIFGSIKNLANNLALIDNFLYNSEKVSRAYGEQQNIKGLALENGGLSAYITVMKVLSIEKTNIDTLITEIYRQQLRSKIDQPLQDPFLILKEQSLSALTSEQAMKDKLTNCLNDFIAVSKYYDAVKRTTIKYPEYKLSFLDNLTSSFSASTDKLHDFFNLTITKNSYAYITINDYQNYDDSIRTLISQSSLTPNKKDVFETYIKKLNGGFVSSSYEQTSEFLFKSIGQAINSSTNSFINKFLLSSEKTEYRDPNGDLKLLEDYEKASKDNKKQWKINTKPATYAIGTDYLQLALEGRPTPAEKSCGVFPHFLDIDSIKEDAINNKEKSLCADIILNDKLNKNEPVNSEELEKLETSDSQNILLSAVYRLGLRAYLSDIVLRSVATFGVYDPQELRDDNLYIDFIANLLEVEIKSVDARYFSMMTDFFLKQYILLNPQTEIGDTKQFKKQILKNVIREELRKFVFPKLVKRIEEDTNKKITSLNNSQISTISVKRILDNVLELKYSDSKKDIYFKIKQENVILTTIQKINISGRTPLIEDTKEMIIYKSKKDFVSEQETRREFLTSDQFRLLFEYLFPLKRYLSVYSITNILCTSTRKDVIDVFRGTKKELRKLSVLVQTNGQPFVPNLNNPQDVLNSDDNEDALSYILEALYKTPITIAKNYLELMNPNVSVASTIYKVAKAFEPDTPDYVIPSVGVPLGAVGYLGANYPFTFSWFIPAAPFTLDVYNGLYYLLGLWREDDTSEKNKSDKSKQKYLQDLANSAAASQDCEIVKKHDDIVKLDQKDYYKK